MNLATSKSLLTRAHNRSALRILVVDDDRNTREILTEALGLFGADVRNASSVAEARDVLGQWGPDMLVSDLGMPEENGYDLIEEVRRQPAREDSSIPAIALTGYTGIEDRQRALFAGYNEVLTKPAELDALLQAIRRLASADPEPA